MAKIPEVEHEARIAVFGALEAEAHRLTCVVDDLEIGCGNDETMMAGCLQTRGLLLIARALIAKGP